MELEFFLQNLVYWMVLGLVFMFFVFILPATVIHVSLKAYEETLNKDEKLYSYVFVLFIHFVGVSNIFLFLKQVYSGDYPLHSYFIGVFFASILALLEYHFLNFALKSFYTEKELNDMNKARK